MTGRVLPLHANPHRVVDAMLPWYVNGTLDADELALVQRHLGECAQCRDEVEWLRDLHAACAACTDQDRAGSSALTGLRRRLDERPAPRGAWATLPLGWRALAVAQFCVIGVLAWFAFMGSDENAGRYRTLGARDLAPVAGNLVIVFDANARESDMRRALTQAGARVVDGPTRSNAYILVVPDGDEAHALSLLRASPGVALVQPLVAQAAR